MFKPTNELRLYRKRLALVTLGGAFPVYEAHSGYEEPILQMAWRHDDGSIEWKDVPTVYESDEEAAIRIGKLNVTRTYDVGRDGDLNISGNDGTPGSTERGDGVPDKKE